MTTESIRTDSASSAPEARPRRKLFRDDALDRLASPELLDRRLVVVRAPGWLALVALLLLIALTLAWSLLGRVSTTLSGEGLLLGDGGSLTRVDVPRAGRLLRYHVAEGDRVREGQLLAEIEQPELLRQHLELQRKRRQLYMQWRMVQAKHSRMNFHLNNLAQDRKRALLESRDAALEKQRMLETLLKTRQRLLQDGYTPPGQVEEIRDRILQTQESLSNISNQLRNIDLELMAKQGDERNELAAIDAQILEVESQLATNQVALRNGQRIISPADGVVVGLTASRGDNVHPGRPILSLEVGGERLQGLVYVPASLGKQIKPGMKVQLSPSTHPKEEFGFIHGEVVSVSLVPVSTQEMLNDLGDERLVRQFSGQTAPLKVRIALREDAESASGLAWSSAKGRAELITKGTLCRADILVREQRPIELVIPALRKWLGV